MAAQAGNDEELVKVEEAADTQDAAEEEAQALALNAEGLQYWLKEASLSHLAKVAMLLSFVLCFENMQNSDHHSCVMVKVLLFI